MQKHLPSTKDFIRIIVLPVAFCFISIFSHSQTALICGKLIDGVAADPHENVVVVIEDERIIAVGKADIIRPDMDVIDLSDFTVMPGLIDAHVHPLIHGDDYQMNHLKENSAEKALRGLKVVQNWLMEGWTTIRVAGDADVNYAHFAIRDAINNGSFSGPRIVGAGHYLSVTGGGGDIQFLSHEQSIIPDGLIVDGKDEVIKAIRREIKNGSDWIKLLVTGAFMSAGDNPRNVHFSDEELEAAVEEAKRRDIPVMAHAHSKEGILKAIRFGVRSIEHGTFLDEECIDLFLETETYLVPTIYIGEYFLDQHSDSEALSKAVAITRKYRDGYMKNYASAIERGVKIGLGSDNVGFPPGFAASEFEILVNLGMTPMQSIMAGTRVNAEMLQMDDDIGTVEVGKYADIVATRANPLEDIGQMKKIEFVMKGGKVVKGVD